MHDHKRSGGLMETTGLMRSLRAVRRYAPQPIPEEVLMDILESARWTGSGKNRQGWELVVIRDRQRLGVIGGTRQYAGHVARAPLGIAIVTTRTATAFDAGRLAQTLMLAAWAHGVGSCIASIYPPENEDIVRRAVGAPLDRQIKHVIAFGYPGDREAHLVSRAPLSESAPLPLGRQSLADFVNWEQYGSKRDLAALSHPDSPLSGAQPTA